jgi:tryptophanyl-tRNA synthetase
MSKSYGNAIYLKDDEETLDRKIRPMVTDPARKRRSDPGNPDVCPVYDLHKAFSPRDTLTWSAAGCRSASIGCLDCKGRLIDHMRERLAPLRARRSEYAARPDTVWDILIEGSKRARGVAQATMEEVRAAMKISYGPKKP